MYVASWTVVEQFEQRMAAYCGAPYAVAVDTCTAALALCCRSLSPGKETVTLPCRTYLGVACALHHAGFQVQLEPITWRGAYPIYLGNTENRPIVVDSACQLHQGMYAARTLTCLSFQYRKHLKIGRGGMILTDSEVCAQWLRQARFCGRGTPNGAPAFIGWHCFMEPERAARGLVLLDSLPAVNQPLQFDYPDLRTYSVFGATP